MNPINKDKLKTFTLWIGILTALLLIFGTFSVSGDNSLGENLFSWIYQTAPVSELVDFSANIIASLSEFSL